MAKEYTITLSELELVKIINAMQMRRRYYQHKSENQEYDSLDRYMYSLIVDEYDELLEKMNNL